jgi:peptidyl-prolyl cis-trans isomerase D
MITIGKIREKSGLLIGVIGGAMVLYVLGQALNTSGKGAEAQIEGEIYGEPVNVIHLNELEEQFLNMEKQQVAQQQRDFTEIDAQTSADKAWNEYVREALLQKEFEALGIDVNESEVDANIYGTDGFSVYPLLMQYFPDTINKGAVDFKAIQQFQQKAESGEQVQNGVDEYNQPTYFSYSDFWNELRKEIRESRKANKYVLLLQQGSYVTSLEAKEAYITSKTVKNVSYITRNFADYDKKTAVSDAELKTYYDAHKDDSKYEQKDARNVNYVAFDIKPSAEDLANGRERMLALRNQFASAENDSLFVMRNSEQPSYNASVSYHAAMQEGEPNTYPEIIDTIIQNASVGQIVGPYANGSSVDLAKVLGFTQEKQSWVRHILIMAGGAGQISFEQAQAKADSLVNVIKATHNFVELVKAVSEDPGSVNNNGEYKWFPEGRMVPTFNDYSFNAPLNTIGTVKTNYGIHIVEVLGRRTAKLPHLAIVTRTVLPSEGTINEVEQLAKDFWSLADEAPKDFEKIAKDSNYFVRPLTVFLEKPQVYGFSETAKNQALRFIFNKETEKLDVSDPIKDGNRFVVLQLTSIKKEGAPALEDARSIMEIDAKNDKIATIYINEMKGSKDLAATSAKFNAPVQNAEVTFVSAAIGRSSEPSVTGVLFSGSVKDGSTSEPLKGTTGVYMVKVVETIPAPTTKDYTAQKDDMLNKAVGSVSKDALLSLIKFADVKDYRIQNRIGAR